MGFEKITVGGIDVTSATKAEFADIMLRDCLSARDAAGTGTPKVVISANGSVVARYHADEEFRLLVDRADIVDADGMSLVFASRLLSKRGLPERVATTDFVHDACSVAERSGLRFFFLGGSAQANALSQEYFKHKYPCLALSGRDGYFHPSEEENVLAAVKSFSTDVLWLGLGSPNQERLATKWRTDLRGVGWIRTCGGLFDHYSGSVTRAPRVVQRAGLEWLHRASLEPRRLGPRYLKTNIPAAYHLLTKTG